MDRLDKKASEIISRIEPAKPARPNIYTGMILFLISETFLFGALFWSYYYLRANTSLWPPEGVELTTSLAIINTFILLASSGTIWWGEHSIKGGRKNGLAVGLALTLILGFTFLGITIFEWVHETFRPWSHAYGSIFYTLTGFHALHVFGGLMFILALLVRTLRNRFTVHNFVTVEVGSLYWHYVDFIWLIVFTTIFIVR